MGWLLACIFAATAGLLAVLLYVQWEDKKRAVAMLGKSSERLQFLEQQDFDFDGLRTERDALARAHLALRSQVGELDHLRRERDRITSDAKAYVERFNAQVSEAKAKQEERQKRWEEEAKHLEGEIAELRRQHVDLTDEANLRHMGFYEPRYNYTTSLAYQKALEDNQAKQQAMLKSKAAASCTREWTIDGSVAAGKRHTDKLLALMLRAFNGECDSAVSRIRATNFQAVENRVSRAFTAINKLGEPQACAIDVAYLELKIEELRLAYEHALKVQAERDEQRALKEQMRQEAIAARELEKAMQEAEAEEHRRQVALERARKELEQASREQQSAERQAELEARMRELEQQLAEAHADRERAVSMAQQTKAGHVYVISNVGSFGEHVYKIGMTRRLDPMDRIWELSDASVPFDFDVHAIIYTDDAPGLENELHQRFSDRRLNVVNQRKEFFHASIDEIATLVRERCGDIELTLVAEAAEFFQSEAYRRSKGLPLLTERHRAAASVEVT